jgi:hypothetical protein
LNLDS